MQAIIIGDRSKRNKVRNRLTANRDANMLSTSYGTEGFAERTLQFADSNFTHVTTIAYMWSHYK